MLRLLIVLLLLANGAYFAWSQGALAGLGLAPDNPAEPQRIQQQHKPELLRVQPVAQPAELSPAR
jgi:hypothetical protein